MGFWAKSDLGSLKKVPCNVVRGGLWKWALGRQCPRPGDLGGRVETRRGLRTGDTGSARAPDPLRSVSLQLRIDRKGHPKALEGNPPHGKGSWSGDSGSPQRPGASCEGWSVTLTGVLWEWRPPPVLWSGLEELCPSRGATGAY